LTSGQICAIISLLIINRVLEATASGRMNKISPNTNRQSQIMTLMRAIKNWSAENALSKPIFASSVLA
jgi:hypothetical protein